MWTAPTDSGYAGWRCHVSLRRRIVSRVSGVEPPAEVVRRALDPRREAGDEERDVELPLVAGGRGNSEDEVVPAQLGVVLVPGRSRATEQRVHRLEGRRPAECGCVHDDVVVAPHHQAGLGASERDNAAGPSEPLLERVLAREWCGLRLEPLLAGEQLGVARSGQGIRR